MAAAQSAARRGRAAHSLAGSSRCVCHALRRRRTKPFAHSPSRPLALSPTHTAITYYSHQAARATGAAARGADVTSASERPLLAVPRQGVRHREVGRGGRGDSAGASSTGTGTARLGGSCSGGGSGGVGGGGRGEPGQPPGRRLRRRAFCSASARQTGGGAAGGGGQGRGRPPQPDPRSRQGGCPRRLASDAAAGPRRPRTL